MTIAEQVDAAFAEAWLTTDGDRCGICASANLISWYSPYGVNILHCHDCGASHRVES